MGRIPKHPEDRLRINKTSLTMLPVKHDVKAPRLSRGVAWTVSAKEYWKTVWESPMAVVFIDVDVPALERLTYLQMIVKDGGEVDRGILGEIRQLEDRFGLSPLARRRLQYDIDKASGTAPPVKNKHVAVDERFLRAVGDDS